MTTTVISTVETETAALTYNGGNLLITGTGGVIDTSGDALSFVSTASQLLGQAIMLLHQTLAHLTTHDFAFA